MISGKGSPSTSITACWATVVPPPANTGPVRVNLIPGTQFRYAGGSPSRICGTDGSGSSWR
jgi:hypothetical protein